MSLRATLTECQGSEVLARRPDVHTQVTLTECQGAACIQNWANARPSFSKQYQEQRKRWLAISHKSPGNTDTECQGDA
jgi:hypothetical protein